MSKVQNFTCRSISRSAGSTTYNPIGDCQTTTSTSETLNQQTYQTAGTLSNLFVLVSANATSASSTVRTRKNVANGNLTVTIGSGATGEFEDDSNTDSVVAGDELNYQVVAGAGGSLTTQVQSVVFSASSNTVKKFATDNIESATASSTFYVGVTSNRISSANNNETDAQWTFETAGTLKNFFVNITSNARTTNTTIGTRKNTANGAMSVTIGSGATGFFEDTVNTDSIAVNDVANYYITTGTGTGTIADTGAGADFETTNNTTYYIEFTIQNNTMARNSTLYTYIAARLDTNRATESEVASDSQIPVTLSLVTCYVSANSISSGDTTVRLRKNAANGNQLLTIGATATGTFQDAVNRDSISNANEINWSFATGVGAGTETITFQNLGCLVSSIISSNSTLLFMNVG